MPFTIVKINEILEVNLTKYVCHLKAEIIQP